VLNAISIVMYCLKTRWGEKFSKVRDSSSASEWQIRLPFL